MNSAHRLRLLVEGKDDYHVTGHLLNENNVLRFDVKDCEGFNKVMDVFRAELKGSAAERIGIVVDADGEVDNGGPESRWESLRHLLGECGFEELPAEMPQTGLVTRGGDKPVGVWLMPDNRSRGMLEHFVETLVPERDRLWDRALKAVSDIPLDERKFRPQATPKAEVHTWLAWQEDPGTPMGLAIKQRYFDPSAPSAQVFIEWVNKLLAVKVPE